MKKENVNNVEEIVETVEENVENVEEKTEVNNREIVGQIKPKSKITIDDLKNGREFIPTTVTFVKTKSGRYRISFPFGTYSIPSKMGEPIKREFLNDPEFMSEVDMAYIINTLGVTAENLSKFKVKGYLRMIRVKGTAEDNGNKRDYDFLQYELFIITNKKSFNGSNIFYHRNINTNTRKVQALSFAVADSFYSLTDHPYCLRETLEEVEEDYYGD